MRLGTEEALRLTAEKVRQNLSKGGSGFKDVFELLKKGEGKYLRTRLGLICSADEKGTVDKRVTDRLCALELLHLATLVHDDIIDGAKTRRGLPSVQAAFGKHGAVIAGDYLLTRCFSVMAEDDENISRMLVRAVAAVCRGEMLQERSLFDRTVTPYRYLRTVSGKTAALFAAAAAVSDRNSKLLSIGHKFGIVYQIADDIRDFTGSDKTFGGKPCFSDLKSGVMTLPAVYCLLKSPDLSDDGIIKDIGYGIGRSRELADRYREKACTLADRAGVNKKQELNNMFERIMS